MKEVLSKGLDYLWGNVRFNPVKEAFYSLICMYKGHKPVRNAGLFIMLATGMVGGWFCFIEVPTFYDWGSYVVSAAIPDIIIRGFDGMISGAGQVVIDCGTGALGLWIGGTVVGTAGKQTFRVLMYQMGGNTNAHYVLTGSQIDQINEAMGLVYEDLELGRSQSFTREALQNCCPVTCFPHIRKTLLTEEHLLAQNNTKAALDQLIADLNTYKYDGTHRKAELKYALNEALRGIFKPLVEYLSRRQEQAQRRSLEAHDLIEHIDSLIGHEVEQHHGFAQPIALDHDLKRSLEQMLAFYDEANTSLSQYNVFPKQVDETKIKTYGDLYSLRNKALQQKAKQEQVAKHNEQLSNYFKPSCSIATV